MKPEIKLPQLGFGVMRFPLNENDNTLDWLKTEEIIDVYMKGDFCYFDTHPAYINGKSEDIIKKIVVDRYPRSRYMIADKMPFYIKNKSEYDMYFEGALNRLGIEKFNYYLLHSLSDKVYAVHEKLGGFDYIKQKKKDGKIDHIGFSFHGSAEVLEEILIHHPEMEFVQLQINFLDWESEIVQSKKCYEVARQYNKAIMVMEPIKGGSLANALTIDGKELTSSELARISLEFVASLSGINVILSGMTEKSHVLENRATINRIIQTGSSCSLETFNNLIKEIKRRNTIECTACKYCVRECPKDISIPKIFSLMNDYYNKGKYDKTALGRIRIFYDRCINVNNRAGQCIKCGRCEKNCPQKIQIRKFLAEAVMLFEKN